MGAFWSGHASAAMASGFTGPLIIITSGATTTLAINRRA